MPTTKTFSDRTGLPRLRRWTGEQGIYTQVEQLKDKVEQQQSRPHDPDALIDPPELATERGFPRCIRELIKWWWRVPESDRYAAGVILEKRLRPDFAPPGPPKPPLDTSEIDPALQRRVVEEGIEVYGSAEQVGVYIKGVLNASHFSNDPGNWSIHGENEPVYRAVPRTLLLEILEAYPRAGQANGPTEAVTDVLSWLFRHGVTAIGQVVGRGRYAIAIVRNEGSGELDVACYDPHNYQRVLNPDFRATPREVHSGKYNGYREGPYDTRYGIVLI